MNTPAKQHYMLNESSVRLVRAGAIVCGVAVILGAFGAHALKGAMTEWYDVETAASKLESWETGVRYQMFHGLGLLLLGCVGPALARSSVSTRIASCFGIGILVFSGGLYAWVLTDIKPFVMAVPIGGVAFILGWALFACAGFTGFAGKHTSELKD